MPETLFNTGGADANVWSDLSLYLYLFFLAPGMVTGYLFARRGLFVPHHKWMMTLIVLLNWVLIIGVMLSSYADYVAPFLSEPQPRYHLLPTAHLITGALGQLLATYLVLMMWTQNTRLAGLIPYRFQNIKRPMRLTLSLWLLTILLGIGIYFTWYPPVTQAAPEAEAPVVTEEPSVTEEPEITVTATALPEVEIVTPSPLPRVDVVTPTPGPVVTEDADGDAQ